MFCKKGVLKNFAKFTPATLFKKRLSHRCFPVNFAKFLRAPFLIEHLQWLLLPIISNCYSQQIFKCCFSIVFRLIWRRDVVQRQINFETTLCTSTLSNVKLTLSVSTLIWTTLDNVETTSSFQRRFSQRWATSKQRCKNDHLKKVKIEPRVKNKMFLSLKWYTGLKSSSFYSPF